MFTESAEFYDAIYTFKNYRSESRQVAALVRQSHPGARSILDVACGTGEHARWLTDDHGFAVDGLDLDEALLKAARGKAPGGRFVRADMSAFDLHRQYDAVICLFSSIAYLVTLDRVGLALACFRRHVTPEGVALVEPWFEPGVIDPTRVSRQSASVAGRRVDRVSQVDVDGRVSRIHFRYEIEDDQGTRETEEIHELGLFTGSEMQAAFEAAGFQAAFDPAGPSGRGLWIARPRRAQMPNVMRALLMLVLAFGGGVFAACGSGEVTPEFVYLRGDSVTVAVEVRSERQVRINEWLPLKATRTTSGQWLKVPFAEVPANTPWIGYIPLAHEAEVAANLRWYADPSEGVSFDALAPKPVPILERAVRFTRPGTYRLWATSHAPIDATSNSLLIEVLPK